MRGLIVAAFAVVLCACGPEDTEPELLDGPLYTGELREIAADGRVLSVTDAARVTFAPGVPGTARLTIYGWCSVGLTRARGSSSVRYELENAPQWCDTRTDIVDAVAGDPDDLQYMPSGYLLSAEMWLVRDGQDVKLEFYGVLRSTPESRPR